MTLTFDEPSHEYRLGDRVLPHVTAITDALCSYAGVPADVLAAAADRGQAVHFATELHDTSCLGSVPDEIAGFWKRGRRCARKPASRPT